ncbi:nuclear RNA export factor 1 [Cephus cinctus]|uniref:Nuclear RNA export factor 1 n=1 Tax=Cephus cinctus TaxID=211228 RepID=A0AAJ7BV84_CEPCN|nr:nuclear RNA export factor 1 [Cephus cinctus]
MPKKTSKNSWGGRRLDNAEDKHFFGHDDRSVRLDGTRPRVSFKNHARPIRDRQRYAEMAIKNHLDDDILMALGANNNNNGRQVIMRGRGRGTSQGRNSPLPPRGLRGGMLQRSRPMGLVEANWYKVLIPYGQKYDKKFVLTSLHGLMAPDTFVPIMYKVVGNDAVFYIEDFKIANKLLNCDRRVTTSDGFKLHVRVKPGYPQCDVDESLKARLKLALVKRYIPETKALDLSKFHQDSDLVADYFCALFRAPILMAVLDIVSEYVPDLEALNLDGNKLNIIERLNVLHKKFSCLKILYIGDNKIREMNQLDVIKDLKLEEFRLAGNPVCFKYKSRHDDYVSDVRKRFPKLLKLDGNELPRPIVFDVADEGVKLPPSQRMFVANAKAQEIGGQFMQQFFLIFDSENRQPLLDAYHEHACFSMTISCANNANKLNNYLTENRNLRRLNDTNKRRKLLKQGRLPVVSFISQLPRTKHDLNSFTMDISLVTETMMLITVTGLFKELDSKEEFIRYFNRTFVIVPEGSGYCIRNEQLHISQPSEMQERKAFLEQSVDVSGSVASGSASSSASSSTVPVLSQVMKEQMTMTLSQQTNMNLEWSLKCLEEVQWNFDKALSTFHEFYKLGQIPPAAFEK